MPDSADSLPVRPVASTTSWLVDAGISYAGGVIIGAPFGLPLVWITGVEEFLTVTIVASMVVVLALRRARARQAAVRAKPRSESHAT